ncbi:MAG TPA: hypothetical protein VHO90_00570 [Bacteroidales bacterium]|nr:hypothetical protein [Bacteroidales bacterium]
MKKYLNVFAGIAIAILLIASCTGSSSDNENYFLDLNKGWKFKTGDSLAWAKPDYNDSSWDSIAVGKNWEAQGYENYNGFAWYRTKVVIPSSLKENAFLKDSIQFMLGRIDDNDQFYLNGVLIGENNKITSTPTGDSAFYAMSGFWNMERNYILPANNPNILWDKENVIAIRVADHDAGGGIFTSNLKIQMLDIHDKLVIDKSHPFQFEDTKISKTYVVKNNSQVELKGKFTIEVIIDETNASLFKTEESLDLKPSESKEILASYNSPIEAASVNLTFAHSDSKITVKKSRRSSIYSYTQTSGRAKDQWR